MAPRERPVALQPRGKRITPARRERMARVLQHWRDGKTYRAIAEAEGVSLRQVELDLKDALGEVTLPGALEVRQKQDEQNDLIIEKMVDRLIRLQDPKAAEQLGKAIERRARWYGTDTPDGQDGTTQVLNGIQLLIQASQVNLAPEQ